MPLVNTYRYKPNGKPAVKTVVRGRPADFYCPIAPQWWLARSFHPYAPFPGNALEWSSNVYDDGSTYEGLTMIDIPHNKGVLKFGTIGGGGVRASSVGDKYEGEFDVGYVHGLGRMTRKKAGTVYVGEWYAGKRRGCGVEWDMGEFFDALDDGLTPGAAWRASRHRGDERVRAGTWLRDRLIHEGGDERKGRYCTRRELAGVVQEAHEVATKAAMFAFKPDGDANLRTRLDAQGQPVWLLQDPLAYPYNTHWLAPGPLGDAHAIPDSKPLRRRILSAWKNHQRIWDRYNLRRHVPEGSELDEGAGIFEAQLEMFAAFKEHLSMAGKGRHRPAAVLPKWRQRGALEPGEEGGPPGAPVSATSRLRDAVSRLRNQRGGWGWRGGRTRFAEEAGGEGGGGDGAAPGAAPSTAAEDDEDLLVGGDEDEDYDEEEEEQGPGRGYASLSLGLASWMARARAAAVATRRAVPRVALGAGV